MISGANTDLLLNQPPFYVTAFSSDGLRHEGLVESDKLAPKWFRGKLTLHISAPSGTSAETVLDNATPESGYRECLRLIGRNFVWKPVQATGENFEPPVFELWSSEDADVELVQTWIRVATPTNSSSRCVAVVRHVNGTVLHTEAHGLMYIDVGHGRWDETVFVPRAIIDTGLAGAFWGFVEQNNRSASGMVTKALLARLFDEDHLSPSEVNLVAASHALLTHKGLLSKYGDRLLSSLDLASSVVTDLILLRALIELALRSPKKDLRETLVKHVCESLAEIVKCPPTYGETLRLLDAKYSLLSRLMDQSEAGPEVARDLELVGETLTRAFVGGQLAVYVGEPDHVLDQKKNFTKLALKHLAVQNRENAPALWSVPLGDNGFTSKVGQAPRQGKPRRLTQTIKLKFKAFEHMILDAEIRAVIETAKRTGSGIIGPVPLKSRIEKFTVNRSPHINKKSREQFEIRTHSRVLWVTDLTDQTLDAMMKLDLNSMVKVDVSIEERKVQQKDLQAAE
jgi:small subunit ribosomal protein S10